MANTATENKGLGLFLRYWLPLVVWIGAIFLGSSLSADTVEGSPLPLKAYPATLAIAHAVEFAVVAVLVYRLLGAYRRVALPWLWVAALAVTIAFAASDELHQAFVPGRVPSWLDLGFDALGAVVGLALWEGTMRFWRLVKRGDRESRQIDAPAEQQL